MSHLTHAVCKYINKNPLAQTDYDKLLRTIALKLFSSQFLFSSFASVASATRRVRVRCRMTDSVLNTSCEAPSLSVQASQVPPTDISLITFYISAIVPLLFGLCNKRRKKNCIVFTYPEIYHGDHLLLSSSAAYYYSSSVVAVSCCSLLCIYHYLHSRGDPPAVSLKE